MKRHTLAAAVLASFLTGAAVQAQVVERVWDNGTVWTIGLIDVKPGQFNAYMKYVRETVLPRIDYGKRTGAVLDYKILAVQNPRKDEPDILVLQQFKNMAAFDRGPEFFEELSRKTAGSLEAREAQLARGRQLADPMGSMMARELRFIR
ncbi:MAG TPA: hypothetical protein VF750_05430 [Sphingomicrobium sp.]